MKCVLCPIKCEIDRNERPGLCGASRYPKIASVMPYLWEEPCISGSKGSGAVFFSGCNLKCVFCQNYELNDGTAGKEATPDRLAEIFLALEKAGLHNINLVTPAPHLGTIIPAIRIAKQKGLRIPIVYNTNAYETKKAIHALDGLVDIYMPDFKYYSDKLAERFSSAPNYYAIALEAITEMFKQVGHLSINNEGLADKGLLIRHLVLPNCIGDSRKILDTIYKSFGADTYLSLMRQYAPTENVRNFPLNRKLTDGEYERITEYCISLGFKNVYLQDADSASLSYTPDFLNLSTSVEELLND